MKKKKRKDQVLYDYNGLNSALCHSAEGVGS